MSKQLKIMLNTDSDQKSDRIIECQYTKGKQSLTQRNEQTASTIKQQKNSQQQIKTRESPKYSSLHKHSFQQSTGISQKYSIHTQFNSPRSPKSNFDLEQFNVKQYWRNLSRWQGFDDYIYLRNPNNLRIIKGRDILTKQDIVEPLINYHNGYIPQAQILRAEEELDEYKQQLRRQQAGQMKKMYQPGEVNYQKFNPNQYKQAFLDESSTIFQIQNDKQNILIEKILVILQTMNERLAQDEIITLSSLGEKMLRILWKIGCLNLFLMGAYVHNLILNIYGRAKLAYTNWKKIIRICNIQGNCCHKFKQVAYKHISKLCLKLQLYDKSLIYLKKLLKLSWIINDENYELFTYDQISLSYYYKQDVDKALFYHEKFAQGEPEKPNQGLRTIGEVAYLLNAKIKEGQMDQNSYSEDDFDLDALLHKGNFNKWETENKRKDLHRSIKSTQIIYKKGPSFGKIGRNQTDAIDYRKAKVTLHEYQNKVRIPLGPFFKKEDKSYPLVNQLLLQNNQNEKVKTCQFLINQRSTNREAINFLLQEELKEHQIGDIICFKPQENVFYIKKLLRIFSFDLKYFKKNNTLFFNGAITL